MKFKIGMTAIKVWNVSYNINSERFKNFSIQLTVYCFQYIAEDLSGNKASCIFYVRVLGESWTFYQIISKFFPLSANLCLQTLSLPWLTTASPRRSSSATPTSSAWSGTNLCFTIIPRSRWQWLSHTISDLSFLSGKRTLSTRPQTLQETLLAVW